MGRPIARRLALAAILLTFFVAPPRTPAQDAVDDAAAGDAPVAAAGEQQRTLADNWEDLLHYIKIGRADMARSYAQAILESDAEPVEVYRLSVDTPGALQVLKQGEGLEGLAPLIERLRGVIERGYENQRSDPEEIAKAIERLGGTLRGYELAKERLVESGEYAVPQLVQKLADPDTPATLRERIVALLPHLGRPGVRPMSSALQSDSDKVLQALSNALGEIGYYFAAPRLKELTGRDDVLDRTREIARIALMSCAGREAVEKSAAELFYDLSQQYYYGAESLLPPDDTDTANVWYWRKGLGLVYKPVPREIFMEAYAMRMARLALQHDPEFFPAVSLWVAANLRKEAQLPEGASDATRGENQPAARYYALASGAGFLQDVLARALKDRDTAVALGAIRALSRTAGAKSLVRTVTGGVQPLVQALTYPDRNVRFLAAVTLARALPERRFSGSELVMPTLADALRQTGQPRALLVAADQDQANLLKNVLREQGYAVLEATDARAGLTEARATAGVDLVVVGTDPDAEEIVRLMRADPLLAGVCVIVADSADRDLAETDERTVVIPAEPQPAELTDALTEAREKAMCRPLSDAEAADWAVKAANALRDLGLTATTVYNIARTREALIVALHSDTSSVRLAAGEALAVLASDESQQAVAARAVGPEIPDADRIELFKSLSASLRRHGNQLTDPQVRGVLDIVTGDGAQDLREAAAQALGAMDLPSENVRALFLETTPEQ